MSKVLVTETYLEDIADAIRSKNGSTDTYTPAEMASAISDISGGGGSGGEPTSVKIIFATDSNGYILLTDTYAILTASGVSF